LPGFTGLGNACGSSKAIVTQVNDGEIVMTWTTPTLVEMCIGLEINGYLPAEL
jgi:coenzyme PQQ precursor peptide PqqA